MSWAGLGADEVCARLKAKAEPARVLSRGACAMAGACGFGAVSLVVFGSVAYAERWLYGNLGVAGAYVLWTLLFVGLGGLLLGGLVFGPGARARFTGVFALGFALYAAGWCAGWFMLGGFRGEVLGSVAGTVVLGAVLSSAFGALGLFGRVLPWLLLGNLTGYFVGEAAWQGLDHAPHGMLLWGLIYGLAVGAGLGLSLHLLQTPHRMALAGGRTRP
jgi:hypothetical protein